MDHYGVRSTTKRWVKAFLSNRQQQVVVDGTASTKAPVVSGVPQGSVLGPLLFLTYINDLPAAVKSNVRLFADDCVIYRHIKSNQDTAMLQDDLDSLARWEKKWKMSFNVAKCHIMHISRARNPRQTTYTLNDQPLGTVKQATYLGIELSKDLSWSPHTNKVCSKASQSLGFLQRNFHSARPETKTAAYRTIVRPILEYSASAWDPYLQRDIQKIEAVQRRAARFVTNTYQKTPGTVTNIMANLQWETLEERRQNARLSMFYKIIHNKVEIDHTQYMTPSIRPTRSSHHLSFQKPHTSLDYYKFSFFPEPLPFGTHYLHMWSALTPLRDSSQGWPHG